MSYFTDFTRPEYISEFYSVSLKVPDTTMKSYRLLPVGKNDLFYFNAVTRGQWLHTYNTTDDIRINLGNVHYSGFYVENLNRKGEIYKIEYDKNAGSYMFISTTKNERGNSLTYLPYILFQVFKSILLTMLGFVFFAVADYLFLGRANPWFRASLAVSAIQAFIVVGFFYHQFYFDLIF